MRHSHEAAGGSYRVFKLDLDANQVNESFRSHQQALQLLQQFVDSGNATVLWPGNPKSHCNSGQQRHDPFQWSSFINDLLYASHHPWTPAAESACEEARSHVAVSRVEAGPADKTSRDFERPDPSCAALPQRPEGSSPLYGVPHGLPRRPELLGGEFPRLPGGPVPGNRESPQTQWRPQSGDAGHKKCASVKRCSNVQCNADGGRAENPTFAGKRGSHSRSASGLAAPPSGPSLGPQRPRGPSMAPWRIDGSVPLSQDPMGPKDALPSGNPSPCPDPHQAGAPTGPNRSPALGPPAPSLPQPGVGSPYSAVPLLLMQGRCGSQPSKPAPARAQGLPLPSGSPTVPSDEGPPDSGVATSLGRAQPAACLPLPAGRPQACSTARQIGPSLVNGPSQGGSPPQPGRVSGLSRGRKRPRDGSCGLSQGASPAGGKAMRQATLSFGKNLEGKSSGAKDIGWKGVSRKEGKVEQEGSLLASTGPRMKIGVAGAGVQADTLSGPPSTALPVVGSISSTARGADALPGKATALQVCPICGVPFPSTDNDAINRHVDECLNATVLDFEDW